MVVKIFIDKPIAPDELSGQIDAEGQIFTTGSGNEEYLGWVDYEENDVYDEDDCLIGWAEEAGAIIAYYQETEEELEVGYVTETGEIYYYNEDEKEIYFGRLRNLKSFVEGAAALLFFLDREED
jgi:hypothetical protein